MEQFKGRTEARLDKIEDDIVELKENAQDDRKLLTDCIIEMKENNSKLTNIMERNNQDIGEIKSDMSDLRRDLHEKKDSDTTEGLFNQHSGKIIILLIMIIAGLLGINLPTL